MRPYQSYDRTHRVSGAFGYGDSILVGERVRLHGVRDSDLPTLAKWEMDPGRMTTLSNDDPRRWPGPTRDRAALVTSP
jgi:hypothetical protein